MRRADDRLVCAALDWQELAVFAEIRRAGGFASDANVLRSALWSLADDMQIEMPSGVFDQRRPPGPTAECMKSRWPNGAKAKPRGIDKRTLPRKQRSAHDHPWRGPDGLMS